MVDRHEKKLRERVYLARFFLLALVGMKIVTEVIIIIQNSTQYIVLNAIFTLAIIVSYFALQLAKADYSKLMQK